MRGRNRNNNSKGPNPLTRSYESNGPDVKIRGTAQHVAEKYSQLARDALASGDPVAAENYFQHAEHYFRIIATAQEQLREQYGYQQRFDEDGEDEGFPGERSDFGNGNGEDVDPSQQPQPFEQRSDGERQPRFDRNERFGRNDRPERSERQDRGERPERGDRQDRRERFQRERGPRQDYQRQDAPRAEAPRFDFQGDDQPRQERPSQERTNQERPARYERNERGERTEFRRERRVRSEDEPVEAGSLPAFLTNPVRTPIAVDGEADAAPAPAAEPNGFDGTSEVRPRTRRPRRTRREMEEARAAESGGDLVPESVKTPAAE